MICRSAIKPVFIGLGTAAVLAAGGASAVAATEAPSPSTPGSTSPSTSEPATTGKLEVSVSPATATAKPGDKVTVLTHIKAVDGNVSGIKVESIVATPESADATVEGECATGCELGALATGEEPPKDVADVESKVSVPKSTKKTVTVTVTVTVSATSLTKQTPQSKLTFIVPEQSATPTPTKTPTKKPTEKPSRTPSKPSPTPTKSSGTSGSSGSGSSGSGSGGGGSSSSGAGGYVPPSPNSSFSPRNPQVALPPIQAPNPSVAPSPVPGAGTPQSRLQGNKAPVAQDITFERMASTQIAWLAALMVAFSLLLTQLRLGRRRVPAGAAAKRPKGTHRRPRRGMFGK
ncbi:hypothetical protein HUT06_33735 [Actinomadura sp. NAK00032]|uniref:hypothetical protein n=1 Tax=Actinomadura sp. NAK00032 TaxID=2742128 RepID=UPI0015915662|nr:hypothetical protein [Actinomadura sp. NAK00032]QKW38362.1 hypothetical protein HUT06_33735 [Actinomadura sp. NAK00032]